MSDDPWSEYRGLLADLLGTDDLAPLLERAELQGVGAGETLLKDSEPTDSMYLVLDGRLEVHVELGEHTIRLGEIASGNWVGEVAYYTHNDAACSTVTALAPSTLLRLRFARYTELIKSQAEVACRLSHLLIAMQVQRLRATVNDPVLDPEGRLLMLGDLSIPIDQQPHRHGGVLDFIRKLAGVR
ncbi:cyclic nucleotide-binding domain-containing protein [Parasulfuritortus cantonensis]|uniref:Cyclic nucleotide-binding domain-containing protein n=1 Tax=Parasulfuritortus cantonensis TaxID=2528202 RepID=A0A4R1B6N3_9PROT|nr:cyclic nucleotide-binding domain-containing protein [Parasulfuritortus cantonensis]TCJ11958.1 cyclic nucleotide-binding domain-containing protein [Parasulfuritortus cantonensis]